MTRAEASPKEVTMRALLLSLLTAVATLTGCGNVYHPEFHPTTVSHYSQNVSYPVTVQNGGDPATRSPVYIAPAPIPAPAQVP